MRAFFIVASPVTDTPWTVLGRLAVGIPQQLVTSFLKPLCNRKQGSCSESPCNFYVEIWGNLNFSPYQKWECVHMLFLGLESRYVSSNECLVVILGLIEVPKMLFLLRPSVKRVKSCKSSWVLTPIKETFRDILLFCYLFVFQM